MARLLKSRRSPVRGSRFRRKSLLIILLASVFFIGVIFISSYHTTNRIKLLKKRIPPHTNVTSNKNKSLNSSIPTKISDENIIILFWTAYFGDDPLSSMGTLKKLTNSAPKCFQNCKVVTDRDYLSVSDAVIFHSRDLRRDDLPPVRSSNQLWIYLQSESPSNTKANLEEFANVFNWTMTYRRDSDIYYPYGRVSKRDSYFSNSSLDLESSIQKKSKLVLWIVSNCHTKGNRERLVDELVRYIPVDVYGHCGDHSCSRKTQSGSYCLSQLAPQYKFYLSFENSVCSDYVTEKFFRALRHELVPVVYGGANYDSFAPPNSFINVYKFESVEALANYLNDLDRNPKKYQEYFKWKGEYKVYDETEVGMDSWCDLCQKLKEHKKNPRRKIYGNLWKWWNYIRNEEPKNSITINNNEHLFLSGEESDKSLRSEFPEGSYIPVCQDDLLFPSSVLDIFHTWPLTKFKRWLYRLRGY